MINLVLAQPFWYTWKGIAAVGQVAGAVGTVIAVIIALWQTRIASKSAQRSNELAEKSVEIAVQQLNEAREKAELERKQALERWEFKLGLKAIIGSKEVVIHASNQRELPAYVDADLCIVKALSGKKYSYVIDADIFENEEDFIVGKKPFYYNLVRSFRLE